MIIGIANMPLTPVFRELLTQQYIPLKPEGVRVKYYAISPLKAPLFAWNCDSKALQGWSGKDKKGGCWPSLIKPIHQY